MRSDTPLFRAISLGAALVVAVGLDALGSRTARVNAGAKVSKMPKQVEVPDLPLLDGIVSPRILNAVRIAFCAAAVMLAGCSTNSSPSSSDDASSSPSERSPGEAGGSSCAPCAPGVVSSCDAGCNCQAGLCTFLVDGAMTECTYDGG